MKVWTMQPVSAWEELKKTGVYRCQREKSFNLTKRDSLEKPYQWLSGKMKEKVGLPPEGVSYPVWAWHTWEFERRSPDPDSAAFLRRTEDKALFTLDLPPERVVLTDFDAWQLVLQNMYVTDAETEEALDELQSQLEEMDEAALAEAIRQSWDHVFLIDPIQSELITRGRYIQATFWEIRKEDVEDVRILPAE